jgi:hypothetical protein
MSYLHILRPSLCVLLLQAECNVEPHVVWVGFKRSLQFTTVQDTAGQHSTARRTSHQSAIQSHRARCYQHSLWGGRHKRIMAAGRMPVCHVTRYGLAVPLPAFAKLKGVPWVPKRRTSASGQLTVTGTPAGPLPVSVGKAREQPEHSVI